MARLPVYLRVLRALTDRGVATASSDELAAEAGVNPAKLRRDLSYLGSYGTRGVGYEVSHLSVQIGQELGLSQEWPVVIVGIGRLGHALAAYGGFASRGLRVAGLLDHDRALVGTTVAGVLVSHLDDLEALVADSGAVIAVVSTPASAAQGVCDRLVAAGVTSVLNFAPAALTVPDHVVVRKVDLATELQILAFGEQRRAAGTSTAGEPAADADDTAGTEAAEPADHDLRQGASGGTSR